MRSKSRLQKIEQIAKALANTPDIVKVCGTRADGTTYRIRTWKQLIDAERAGHLANCPQWQKFIKEGDGSGQKR